MAIHESLTIDGTTINVTLTESGQILLVDRCPYCGYDDVHQVTEHGYACDNCDEVFIPKPDRMLPEEQ